MTFMLHSPLVLTDDTKHLKVECKKTQINAIKLQTRNIKTWTRGI